ncbi:hypothetical protein I4U23_005816 [Adineta vaga]|nr:hypothetical protein I4U23_005816 [Adineta vaga]
MINTEYTSRKSDKIRSLESNLFQKTLIKLRIPMIENDSIILLDDHNNLLFTSKYSCSQIIDQIRDWDNLVELFADDSHSDIICNDISRYIIDIVKQLTPNDTTKFMLKLCWYREMYINNLLEQLMDLFPYKLIIQNDSGSKDPESDYDIRIGSTDGSDTDIDACVIFNEFFSQHWSLPSGIVFDTNLYPRHMNTIEPKFNINGTGLGIFITIRCDYPSYFFTEVNDYKQNQMSLIKLRKSMTGKEWHDYIDRRTTMDCDPFLNEFFSHADKTYWKYTKKLLTQISPTNELILCALNEITNLISIMKITRYDSTKFEILWNKIHEEMRPILMEQSNILFISYLRQARHLEREIRERKDRYENSFFHPILQIPPNEMLYIDTLTVSMRHKFSKAIYFANDACVAEVKIEQPYDRILLYTRAAYTTMITGNILVVHDSRMIDIGVTINHAYGANKRISYFISILRLLTTILIQGIDWFSWMIVITDLTTLFSLTISFEYMKIIQKLYLICLSCVSIIVFLLNTWTTIRRYLLLYKSKNVEYLATVRENQGTRAYYLSILIYIIVGIIFNFIFTLYDLEHAHWFHITPFAIIFDYHQPVHLSFIQLIIIIISQGMAIALIDVINKSASCKERLPDDELSNRNCIGKKEWLNFPIATIIPVNAPKKPPAKEPIGPPIKPTVAPVVIVRVLKDMTMLLWAIVVSFVLLTTLNINVNAYKSYSQYQLWRLNITNDEQVKQLVDFRRKTNEQNINFWSEDIRTNIPIDVSIAPKSLQSFNAYLSSDVMKMQYDVIMKDIGAIIQGQKLIHRSQSSKMQVNDFEYDKYHTLDEIHAWIDTMVATYPSLATSFIVGQSYENRPLKGLKISSNKFATKQDGTAINQKKAVWWDGGIHSREWISPATNIYIAYAFLSNYNKDPTITHLIDQFDYYILPVFNVDGYVYTWTKDRLWRKTRSKTSKPNCFGADPNRNWDYHWCESGASSDPCDDTYCGSKAFSEVETAQVAKFIQEHADTIIHYINFHSYSQFWMSPWGYTTAKPVHFKLQDDGSAVAVQALAAVYGTKYIHGNIASIIYVASGSSADWTYGKVNITFSYGVELRDTGKYGFLLPEDQIIPTGQETLAGELALLKYIEGHVYA